MLTSRHGSDFMETLNIIVQYVSTVFIILVVLVQGGNQGGIGAAFGGGNTQGVFGASGATSFLGKLTYAMGAIFMVSSISLTIIQGKSGDVGLSEKLKKANTQVEDTIKKDGQETEKTDSGKDSKH